jgi:DNA-binding NarL/FixJ family response regulator
MKDCRVLIAVEPPSFQRLIEHVLHGHEGVSVVGLSSKSVSPALKAGRLAPDVIIVNHRLQRKTLGDVLVDLKRSSPVSTVILLTHDLTELAPQEGADVCLPEGAVVKRLLPMIRKAALRAADRTPLPASAGART